MIRVDDAAEVRVVTIDRADKANSLTYEILVGLRDATRGAEGLRAFVVTGAGDRVFSAGMDLEAAKTDLPVSAIWEDVSGAIAALPCLTIAALNGTLAGGAMGMALACDLRLTVPSARFFYPVAKLGFLPQPSDPARLAALIGPARAKMILMGGQKIGADRAMEWGLVDRITDTPVDDARAMAAEAQSAVHLAAIKAMV